MSSAEDISQQIRSYASLLSSQQAAGLLPSDQDACMVGMCQVFCTQIHQLRSLDCTGSGELNAAIAGSAFGASQKSQLASAVASRVLSQRAPTSGKSRDTQTLLNPLPYFTQSDIEALNKVQPLMHAKVLKTETMVQRMGSIGMYNPTEKTTRGLAAAMCGLLWPESGQPSPADMWNVVLTIKSSFDKLTVDESLPHLITYPANPDGLPGSIYTHAYPPGGEQPVGMNIDKYQFYHRIMVMRTSNSKLQVQTPPSSGASSAGSSSASGSNGAVAALLQHLLSLADPSAGGPPVPGLQNLQILQNPGPAAAGRRGNRSSWLPAPTNPALTWEPPPPATDGVAAENAGVHVAMPGYKESGKTPDADADGEDAVSKMERAAAKAAAAAKGAKGRKGQSWPTKVMRKLTTRGMKMRKRRERMALQ